MFSRHLRHLKALAAMIVLGSLAASPAVGATVGVVVPASANPYLAGMPNGSVCCAAAGGAPDSAPAQSPVQVTGLALTPGTILTFGVTGSVSFSGGMPVDPPDGGVINTIGQFGLDGTPSSDGIAGMKAPQDALVGLFLDDSLPTSSPAPPRLDFSPAGLGTSFPVLCPGLKEPFFIGDGSTGQGTGTVQQFVVPAGATRFFLGTVDGVEWSNNTGSLSVQVRSAPPAATGPLAAAVLPGSRSLQVGETATAFATILNAGANVGVNCQITPITPVPATFVFQTSDPATNALTGVANTAACVLPGRGQTFVIAFTPTAAFGPTDVNLSFQCGNSGPAPVTSGLDTLLLSSAIGPVPDIVALAATLNNDGIVTIPGANGTGIFAVATVNLGAGGQITVSAESGAAGLGGITLCASDPTTGACLSNPTASVTVAIGANATPTFAVFVQGQDVVPFDPATNRIFVRFKNAGGVILGSTSVAVRTQ